MKSTTREQRFVTVEDLKQKLLSEFKAVPQSVFEKSIEDWKSFSFINIQRLKWLGYVLRMENQDNQTEYKGSPGGVWPRGWAMSQCPELSQAT